MFARKLAFKNSSASSDFRDFHSAPAHSSSSFDHFAAQVLGTPQGSTPGWFGLVFNAIRLATETMSDALVPEMIRAGGGLSAINVRVLPTRFSALGRREAPGTDQWSRRVAELVLSKDKSERRLGLWFLLNLEPYGITAAFYEGLRSDDPSYQDLCRRALVSIEPQYENYMPRLMERLRETDQNDELFEYIFKISSWVRASARLELGEERVEGNPMDKGFFDD